MKPYHHLNILRTLADSSCGRAIASYFGIGAMPAEQSDSEAERADALIEELRDFLDGTAGASGLFTRIAEHNQKSSLDPELLRQLMRAGRKALLQ